MPAPDVLVLDPDGWAEDVVLGALADAPFDLAVESLPPSPESFARLGGVECVVVAHGEGTDGLARCRRLADRRGLRVVLLAAERTPDLDRRAVEAGADDWFVADEDRLAALPARLADAVGAGGGGRDGPAGEATEAAETDEATSEPSTGGESDSSPNVVVGPSGARLADSPVESLLDAVGGGPYAVVVVDGTETVHYAGGGVESLTGYEPTALVGESMEILVPEAFADAHRGAMARYLDQGTRHLDWNGVDLVVNHREGHMVPVDVLLGHYAAEEGDYVAAVLRGQEEGVDEHDRFRKHRAFSESVFENVTDLVLVVEDGDVLDANPAASDRLERDYADLVGTHVSDLLRATDGEDLADALRPGVGGGKRDPVTARAIDRDLVVELSTTDIVYEDREALLVTGRDVTARVERQAELERQNERLSEFASIVSHDLRNPLNTASTNAQLVESGHTERIDAVREALAEMETLIEDLLTLARSGQVVDEAQPFSLSTVAESAWRTADPDDAATLDLVGDAEFEGDPNRVRQALGNLFRNALEHGREDEGEPITVRVGPLDGGEGFFVADDGSGVPETEREDVFDHGYTTHEDGTGYGLAIVSDIVEAHDWTIDLVDSESGGARFEVRT